MSDLLTLGLNGFAVATSSGTVGPSGPYYALIVHEEAEFEATAVDGFGQDLPSATLAAEAARYGRFNAPTVTSGTVLCYPITNPQQG